MHGDVGGKARARSAVRGREEVIKVWRARINESSVVVIA